MTAFLRHPRGMNSRGIYEFYNKEAQRYIDAQGKFRGLILAENSLCASRISSAIINTQKEKGYNIEVGITPSPIHTDTFPDAQVVVWYYRGKYKPQQEFSIKVEVGEPQPVGRIACDLEPGRYDVRRQANGDWILTKVGD